MKAETPAETPGAEVAEVCRVNKYICIYIILGGYRSDLIVILDVQNLQAPEAPAATPEAGSYFLGSLPLSKNRRA